MKKIILFLFLIPSLSYGEAILQASLNAIPGHTEGARTPEQLGKIQPGSPMKVIATVKNTGTEPNASGRLFLRFCFPENLRGQPNSILFETEKLHVPTITPGQEIVIPFNIPHHWPSLFDFIRNDWGMRQYQAILVMGEREQVIGSLSILFSAYYYEGPAKEIPAAVPVRQARPPAREVRTPQLPQSARVTSTHQRQLAQGRP